MYDYIYKTVLIITLLIKKYASKFISFWNSRMRTNRLQLRDCLMDCHHLCLQEIYKNII